MAKEKNSMYDHGGLSEEDMASLEAIDETAALEMRERCDRLRDLHIQVMRPITAILGDFFEQKKIISYTLGVSLDGRSGYTVVINSYGDTCFVECEGVWEGVESGLQWVATLLDRGRNTLERTSLVYNADKPDSDTLDFLKKVVRHIGRIRALGEYEQELQNL